LYFSVSVSLHVAASNKDATTLQHLMKCQQHVENLNMSDSLKRTPLDCAGLSGSLECVEILLANGADPTTRTWIHSVCEGGNIAIIKLLLKKGIYHEHPDANGRWPLDLAFQSGHEDIVEYLRSIKCLEIVITRKIRDLCLSGDVEGLETLSDEGYDLVQAVTDPVLPSSPNDSPATVIFSEVCAGGLLDVCQYLHRMGVGLDHMDALGLTPLHYGVLNGHEGFVEWLLSEGVDILEETKCESGPYCGMTSVHLCAVMGFVGIMKLLLESGAPVDCRRGGVGSTPLFEAVRSGQLEMVNYLCDSGCDVTCVTDENETILHAGAMSGKLKMMKRVRSLWIGRSLSNEESTGRRRSSSSSSSGEGGRDIKAMDIEDSFGTTPFLLSCGVGKVSVMKYLTDEGCNIFHRGGREDRQNSALHFSVCGGHVDATSWLLDHGLNPESQNEAGKTPVDVARSLGMVELSNLLDANLSQFSAMDRAKSFLDPMLESALASEDFERGAVVLREMISMLSSNPEEYVNDDGNTLLHLATTVGDRRLIKQLSRLRFDLNSLNSFHLAPIHLAVFHNHLEALRTLHKLGANFTIRDDIGNTILHLAADRGDDDFVFFIIETWKKINSKNEKGWTALHYACSRGHESIVKTLIDAGAKATIAEGGITPLHLACYNNHSDIAIYLICQSDVDVGHCDDSGMCALDIAESNRLIDVTQLLDHFGNRSNDENSQPSHAPTLPSPSSSIASYFKCTS
jgi:ankyrin repeat protein